MPVVLESTNQQQHFRVNLQDSFYRNAMEVLTEDNGSLFIHRNELVPNGANRFRLRDETGFQQFLADWNANTLVLYRGFPGCHFCWPDLEVGELKSEGNVDSPEFTMSQRGRGETRWLPTADLNMAQGVSLQCCDVHTRALSIMEEVPIGFTLSIHVGKNMGFSICWLNPGEIVVRGPLISPQYRMHSITWLDAGTPAYRPWPAPFPNVFLPRQRPYQPPNQNDIFDWWEDARCEGWMNEIAHHDGVIGAAAVRRAAAAQQRAALRVVI